MSGLALKSTVDKCSMFVCLSLDSITAAELFYLLHVLCFSRGIVVPLTGGVRTATGVRAATGVWTGARTRTMKSGKPWGS